VADGLLLAPLSLHGLALFVALIAYVSVPSAWGEETPDLVSRAFLLAVLARNGEISPEMIEDVRDHRSRHGTSVGRGWERSL